jgi:peptidoglycan/LPS O-acetylase OafA/YrhL
MEADCQHPAVWMRGDGTTSAAPSAELPASSKAPARFAFVDGLRGLAALSIVVFHIWWYEPDPYPALEQAHWLFDVAFLGLRGGVQVLLVISGFVIAYTLRRVWFTPGEVWSFIGRRLVRLVPAYWVALGFVMLVEAACLGLWDLPSPNDGQLSILRTATHLAFLQDIFDQDALGAGMWTLCIEMQFYFTAILGWGLAQRLFPRPVAGEPRPVDWGLMALFSPLAITSLFHWRALESTDPWVTHYLWMFFLGMATWWTLDQTLPLAAFIVVVSIGGVDLVLNAEWRFWNAVALMTALAIFTAGHRGKLHVWLDWWPLQYLGRISYSLYLIHYPICHVILSAGWKWCGNPPTSLQASVILLSAIPASLLAGHMLHRFVEAPSAQWAARMKRVGHFPPTAPESGNPRRAQL